VVGVDLIGHGGTGRTMAGAIITLAQQKGRIG
jgi:hypothetical protein